jgi:hypothetical protein
MIPKSNQRSFSVRWTADEEAKLIELIGLYKPGDWKGILTHARSEGFFLTRTRSFPIETSHHISKD